MQPFPQNPANPFWEYWVDSVQRSLLFMDVLRQRGDEVQQHWAAGNPPVLTFPYETIIEGKTLPRPVNYALLRIIPDEQTPIDPRKRPIFIVDPRAGHGPGIGGSKLNSEIGVALRAGHPVYFVSFHPTPEPGQTIADISRAEAAFLQEVIRRHPDAPKPCVYGNCQAGWAVAMLAAVAPDLMGPVVLSGAQLQAIGKVQFFMLHLDRAAAVAALPRLLPTAAERREALALARQVALGGAAPNPEEQQALDVLEQALGLREGVTS